MTRRTAITAVVAALLLAAVLGWAFRPQPTTVETAQVRQAPFELTIDEDGRTRVRQRYVIAAPLAGRLARIALEPGDPVSAGAPVARIAPVAPALLDARTLRELQERVGSAEAQRAQAAADVARAEAAQAQAQTDLTRQQQLQGEGFVSGAAREQAELALRVQTRALESAQAGRHAAEHALAQARAAVASLRGDGDRAGLPVTSPINGRVLRVLQRSEGPVALGTPLMEVADVADLEIVVDLLSTDAARVPAGARVHIDAGGRPFAGRVRRVEPAAFTKVSALGVEEQRVTVVIDPDPAPPEAAGGAAAAVPPASPLGDGYRVDLRVVVQAQPDAIVVPVAALFRSADRDGWSVFTVVDNRAVQRPVTVGARGPVLATVTAGLAAGERVVVYPGDTLRDGSRVRVSAGG